MGEAFAALVGQGTGLRDAFHDKNVSDTSPEIHDRSEVLTGALYDLFLNIYGGLRRDHGPAGALKRAGRILGTFLVRVADFTPENRMTLEDVAKAYLKVTGSSTTGAITQCWWTSSSAGSSSTRAPRRVADHEATPQLWLRRRRPIARWSSG
jgi:hypothetical protein